VPLVYFLLPFTVTHGAAMGGRRRRCDGEGESGAAMGGRLFDWRGTVALRWVGRWWHVCVVYVTMVSFL
jgi:hypothetical protein